jgi:hypothetical protein
MAAVSRPELDLRRWSGCRRVDRGGQRDVCGAAGPGRGGQGRGARRGGGGPPGQRVGGAVGIVQGALVERLTEDSCRVVPGSLCFGKVFTREDGSWLRLLPEVDKATAEAAAALVQRTRKAPSVAPAAGPSAHPSFTHGAGKDGAPRPDETVGRHRPAAYAERRGRCVNRVTHHPRRRLYGLARARSCAAAGPAGGVGRRVRAGDWGGTSRARRGTAGDSRERRRARVRRVARSAAR